jgi:hypothetical protein
MKLYEYILRQIQRTAYEGKKVAEVLSNANIPFNYSLSYVIMVLYYYYKNDREVYNDIIDIVKSLYELEQECEEQ